MPTRRTLLFNNGETWVKKVVNEEFDLPMGCQKYLIKIQKKLVIVAPKM